MGEVTGPARRQPGRAQLPVLLYGVSLGTIATTLALPHIDGVAGVALDSPIDDLLAAAHRMLSFRREGDRRSWFALYEPWRSLVIAALGWWSGFRVAEVSPGEVLATLPHDLPVLLIGGAHDDRAPPATVRRLFERLPEPPERRLLWLDDDGGHGDLAELKPAEYREHLRWLLEHLRR